MTGGRDFYTDVAAELGHSGLAATFGQRSAEGLISQLTGTSSREARTLVKAAELLPGAGTSGGAAEGDDDASTSRAARTRAAGARVDDGRLLGDRKPAVRILVTKTDLDSPTDAHGNRPGAAYFEGQTDAVSVATAERYICTPGAIPILFDTDGRVLNLGREQRLFSEKQRIALAARDGGCLMCDRPPSWCEAHHIDHWDEHHGRTDIDDGVLLCRHHHLLLHNRNWRIRRTHGNYHLERPDTHGVQRRIPLPTRSRARQRLRSTA